MENTFFKAKSHKIATYSAYMLGKFQLYFFPVFPIKTKGNSIYEGLKRILDFLRISVNMNDSFWRLFLYYVDNTHEQLTPTPWLTLDYNTDVLLSKLCGHSSTCFIKLHFLW